MPVLFISLHTDNVFCVAVVQQRPSRSIVGSVVSHQKGQAWWLGSQQGAALTHYWPVVRTSLMSWQKTWTTRQVRQTAHTCSQPNGISFSFGSFGYFAWAKTLIQIPLKNVYQLGKQPLFFPAMHLQCPDLVEITHSKYWMQLEL